MILSPFLILIIFLFNSNFLFAMDCIIIADADKNFIDFPKSKDKALIVVDGAANNAYKIGIYPDVISGDFDSISDVALQYFKNSNKTKIINTPDQNYTDLEKSIIYCQKEYNPRNIYVLNAIGGDRLDHTIANFRLGKKFLDNNKNIIFIKYGNQCIQHIKNSRLEINGKIGDNVAILSSGDDAFATSNGLKYEMTDYHLIFGVQESTSNELIANNATIYIKGYGIVIYPWKYSL